MVIAVLFHPQFLVSLIPKNTIPRNNLNSEYEDSLTAASLAVQNMLLWSQVSQSIMAANVWRSVD